MAKERDIPETALTPRPACIVIPTTDGLVWLCGFKERSETLHSQVTLVGHYDPLAISKMYHQFVSVPLKQIRTENKSVHIELSGEIDSGRSWEFPVLLAHILHQRGLLAFPDLKALEAGEDPGCDLVWSTGALDADLVPVAGNYSLAQKFCLSQDILEKFRDHRRVDIILGAPLSEEMRQQAVTLARHLDLNFEEIRSIDDISFFNGGTGIKPLAAPGKKLQFVKYGLQKGAIALKKGKFAISAFLGIIALSVGFTTLFPQGKTALPDKKIMLAENKTKETETKELPPKNVLVSEDKTVTTRGTTSDTMETSIEKMEKTEETETKEQEQEQEQEQEITVDKQETPPEKETIPEKETVFEPGNPPEKVKSAVPEVPPKTETPKKPPEKTIKPAIVPSVAEGLVIEKLLQAGRRSCQSSIRLKTEYCSDNVQACQNSGFGALFRSEKIDAVKTDTGVKSFEYPVKSNDANLCGLRFRNTKDATVYLEINRNIFSYAHYGSTGMFDRLTLRPGQSAELYLQRTPFRITTNVQISADKGSPALLKLKF